MQVVITGAATTSTLHESRLKIISRSVESDSESSSEVTKLRLRTFAFFEKVFSKNLKKFQEISKKFKKIQKISKNPEISEKKGNLPWRAICPDRATPG